MLCIYFVYVCALWCVVPLSETLTEVVHSCLINFIINGWGQREGR